MEATHEASQGPLKAAVSAQKALQGSLTETRSDGTETYLPDEGSLICPPGKSLIFTEKGNGGKIELVARPAVEGPRSVVEGPRSVVG